jgi:hypothetical protein
MVASATLLPMTGKATAQTVFTTIQAFGDRSHVVCIGRFGEQLSAFRSATGDRESFRLRWAGSIFALGCR